MEEKECLSELRVEEIDSSELIELDETTFKEIYEQSIEFEANQSTQGIEIKIEVL